MKKKIFLLRQVPMLFAAIMFLSGIILQEYFRLSFIPWLSLAAVLLLTGLMTLERRIVSHVLLALAYICCGSLALSADYARAPHDISRLPYALSRQSVLLHGIVITEPQCRDTLNGHRRIFRMKVLHIKPPVSAGISGPSGEAGGRGEMFEPAAGKIVVHLYQNRDIQHGDELLLEGIMHRPYNFTRGRKFSYKQYLKRQGVSWIISVSRDRLFYVIAKQQGGWRPGLRRWKARARSQLARYFHPEETALLSMLLLGDRSSLPAAVRDIFNRTGTAHVLAISGLHVGIFCSIILILARILVPQRPYAYMLVIMGLIFYILLTGGRPSVVRASIMAAIFFTSYVVERESVVLNTWAVAALLILFFSPTALFEIGFQLSFTCVFFILVLYPRISALWPQAPARNDSFICRYLKTSLSVSLSAWLGAAGLVAYYFEYLTPFAVLANLFIVPLMALIVSLGMAFLILGFCLPPAVPVFVTCLKVSLNGMVALAYALSRMPCAYLRIRGFHFRELIIYYVVLFFLYIIWTHFSKNNKILRNHHLIDR